MKKFFKAIALFTINGLVLSLLLTVVFCLYHNISISDIPPPDLSNSYSFNEKMQFLSAHAQAAGVLAIGSSMTLNNLHSKTVLNRLHTTSYLNTASWGTSMKDNYLLLTVLADVYNPHTIVMVSNIVDFKEVEKEISYTVVRDYLEAGKITAPLFHLKCFNLKYYEVNAVNAHKYRRCRNDYEYLGYDDYGAVNLDSAGFNIRAKRWNNDLLDGKTPGMQYDYLDSISTFCSQRKLRLLFFQSPIRQGLYKALNGEKLKELGMHIAKLKKILARDKHVFIDGNETTWSDVLFSDGAHFNTNGAARFTKYCFDMAESSAAIAQNTRK